MPTGGICKKQDVSGATLQVIPDVSAPNSLLHLQFGGASSDLSIHCFEWTHIINIHLKVSFARSEIIMWSKVDIRKQYERHVICAHCGATQIVTGRIDL
jgi:hypothetical protein